MEKLTLPAPELASTNIVPLPKRAYFRYPSTPAEKLIYEVFTAGKHLDRLSAGKAAASHRKNALQAQETAEGITRVVYTNDSGRLILTVNTALLKAGRTNRDIKKLFIILLAEWDGQQRSEILTIPLKAFVETYQAYSDVRSAKQRIRAAMPALLSLSLQGQQKQGKNQQAGIFYQPHGTPLFQDWHIAGGKLEVILNPDFKKPFLFSAFTSLPTFFFRLSSNGADVMHHIFLMARQGTNLAGLAKGKAFSMSFRALHAALCLPAIGETKNPTRDCIGRIVEAVEDINQTAAGTGLALTIAGNLTGTADSILEACKVQVSMTGAMLESFQPVIELRRKEAERKKRIAARKQKRLGEKIKQASGN